jgi:membrane protease subunit HflK
MYTDAMQEVYSNVTKVVVDSKSGSNLLYLPLDKLMQMTGPSAAAPSTSAAPATTSPATPASRSLDNAARSRERESR